jgi:hypothetical protein
MMMISRAAFLPFVFGFSFYCCVDTILRSFCFFLRDFWPDDDTYITTVLVGFFVVFLCGLERIGLGGKIGPSFSCGYRCCVYTFSILSFISHLGFVDVDFTPDTWRKGGREDGRIVV